MSETAMRVECTECGGSGHGPDRCDGPGDVYQDKCGRCDGRGLEPAGKTDALAVVVTDLEPESALAIGLVDLSLLDRARVVLAASGPDPMPVVRAALRFVEHCTPALEGSAWFEATREFIDAVDAYRKAGGTPYAETVRERDASRRSKRRRPVADLKTTQERRDRFRTWLHDDTRDHMSIRAWCVAEDACQDVDTLLAEVAKLRAVAEAAKELLSESQRAGCGCLSQFPCPRCDAAADVAKAIAALEAP